MHRVRGRNPEHIDINSNATASKRFGHLVEAGPTGSCAKGRMISDTRPVSLSARSLHANASMKHTTCRTSRLTAQGLTPASIEKLHSRLNALSRTQGSIPAAVFRALYLEKYKIWYPHSAGSFVQQRANRYAQRHRQLVDHGDRRIASPAFQVADIGPMQPGLMRKFLLRPAFRLAQTAHVEAQAFTDFHAAQKRLVSPIRLQTNSDIHA